MYFTLYIILGMENSKALRSRSSLRSEHKNILQTQEEMLAYFQSLPSDSEDDISADDDELWVPESEVSHRSHRTAVTQSNGNSQQNSESDSESESEYLAEYPHLQAVGVASLSSEEPSSSSVPVQRTMKGKFKPRPEIWVANKDNDFADGIPVFTGVKKCRISGEMPIDYFTNMFPDSFLNSIVDETNKYAVQCGKENLALTLGELKVFLGINLVITYLRYSRLRQYWSPQHGMRLPLVADNMSYSRFSMIRKYIHFADNFKKPSDCNDRLYKLRPVIEQLRQAFRDAVDPEEFLSIDEMMIPFKGASSLKQYLRSKPHPWGYKVWVLATASGFVLDFEIYQGNPGGKKQSSELGVIGDVVVRLCETVQTKNHKLFFDNLFTSVALLNKLKELGIFASGTIRANRLAGADNKLTSITELKKQPRGSHSVCTSQQSNISITRWHDSSAVHVASTFAGVVPLGNTRRWNMKEKKYEVIPRPYSIEVYNKHMGGVDLIDSLVGLYRHTVRDKRWYMRIFYHFLQVAVVNCWLLWKMNDEEKMDLLEFKSSIATSLIYTGESKQGKRGRPSSVEIGLPVRKKRVHHRASEELRKDGGGHFPEKTDSKYASVCHLRECKRKTRYKCMRCKEPLCPECFAKFH